MMPDPQKLLRQSVNLLFAALGIGVIAAGLLTAALVVRVAHGQNTVLSGLLALSGFPALLVGLCIAAIAKRKIHQAKRDAGVP